MQPPWTGPWMFHVILGPTSGCLIDRLKGPDVDFAWRRSSMVAFQALRFHFLRYLSTSPFCPRSVFLLSQFILKLWFLHPQVAHFCGCVVEQPIRAKAASFNGYQRSSLQGAAPNDTPKKLWVLLLLYKKTLAISSPAGPATKNCHNLSDLVSKQLVQPTARTVMGVPGGSRGPPNHPPGRELSVCRVWFVRCWRRSFGMFFWAIIWVFCYLHQRSLVFELATCIWNWLTEIGRSALLNTTAPPRWGYDAGPGPGEKRLMWIGKIGWKTYLRWSAWDIFLFNDCYFSRTSGEHYF